MPKVSVIVTTFNRKELLTETLNSILQQTYQDFELIVVDNFSNYDFFGHISSFNSDKIIPFQNQNNGIIAVNRNFGIKHAQGEYVAFCDDDDTWYLNKLENQLLFIKETKADLIYTNMLCVSKDENRILNTTRKNINKISQLIRSNEINTSTVMVRNCPLVKFDEDPELIAVEDYFLWLNLLIQGFKFQLLEKVTVRYRIAEASQFNKGGLLLYIKINYAIQKCYLRNNLYPSFFTILIFTVLRNLFKSFIKNTFYINKHISIG